MHWLFIIFEGSDALQYRCSCCSIAVVACNSEMLKTYLLVTIGGLKVNWVSVEHVMLTLLLYVFRYKGLSFVYSFTAKTNRCPSDFSSHAAICCVVWRKHAGIHGNMAFY